MHLTGEREEKTTTTTTKPEIKSRELLKGRTGKRERQPEKIRGLKSIQGVLNLKERLKV